MASGRTNARWVLLPLMALLGGCGGSASESTGRAGVERGSASSRRATARVAERLQGTWRIDPSGRLGRRIHIIELIARPSEPTEPELHGLKQRERELVRRSREQLRSLPQAERSRAIGSNIADLLRSARVHFDGREYVAAVGAGKRRRALRGRWFVRAVEESVVEVAFEMPDGRQVRSRLRFVDEGVFVGDVPGMPALQGDRTEHRFVRVQLALPSD